MEAIILPIEEYEIMHAIMEKDECRNIHSAIKERRATAIEDYPSIDDVLATLSQPHEKIISSSNLVSNTQAPVPGLA